ncbi:MAG: metalloregulator ArsR/SmtB family transcription factor [Rhizobiales bacterium]|nr:metalloregulator ArsR/SmtB family transcription factor [Hyphomicrobiales bacterium]
MNDQQPLRLANPADGIDMATLAQHARRTSDILKALAHESRLMILCILSGGERSVSDIEAMIDLPQPTVSQQLARLRVDGLVTTRRDGRMIYYAIADDEISGIIQALHDLFCKNVKDGGGKGE